MNNNLTISYYAKFINNINILFGNNKLFNDTSIAVSGGSDSIALLILSSIWAYNNKVKIEIMYVNHNLRNEVIEEINYIQYISKQLGYKFIILNWDHENNFTNLQSRARQARYKLMTDRCHKSNLLNLVTGHHEDDYIENFLIKKSRKSKILGLSSHNIFFFNNIRIIRPLYNFKKSELQELLLSNNIKWCEDISNQNLKYKRNQIRKYLLENSDTSLNIKEQQKLINNQSYLIKKNLIDGISNCIKINILGFAIICLKKFLSYSNEIQFYMLNNALITISGKLLTPRYRSTQLILMKIEKENLFSITLHGCIIKKSINNKLYIYREFGKILPSDVNFEKDIIWDNRFKLNFLSEFKIKNLLNLYITYMRIEDFNHIKNKIDIKQLVSIPKDICNKILFTLPVIKSLEKIIIIPHISYYDCEIEYKNKINFIFFPNFVSRFTHFF